MVEVRAARNAQLGKELWQAIVLPEGVNQQCLLPVGQELQIDSQAFFNSSLALFKRSRSSCSYLTSRRSDSSWRSSSACSGAGGD